jgi:hypothetical protein
MVSGVKKYYSCKVLQYFRHNHNAQEKYEFAYMQPNRKHARNTTWWELNNFFFKKKEWGCIIGKMFNTLEYTIGMYMIFIEKVAKRSGWAMCRPGAIVPQGQEFLHKSSSYFAMVLTCVSFAHP